MDKVIKYTLSDQETGVWPRQDAVGEELRRFSRKWMRRGKPAGTVIEVHGALGELIERFDV